MVVDQLGTTFAALSDPTRRGMIERLSHGPASVHGLTESFAISQQMISKHVAYLVRARIVIKTKRGRESVCTLRPEAIKKVNDWAAYYRRFWEESLDKLDVVVDQMKKMELKDGKKHDWRDRADGYHESFRCPTRIGLEGVDGPEVCNAVVGPEGFYHAFLQDGFSRGRKVSLLHENSGWPGVLECQ